METYHTLPCKSHGGCSQPAMDNVGPEFLLDAIDTYGYLTLGGRSINFLVVPGDIRQRLANLNTRAGRFPL